MARKARRREPDLTRSALCRRGLAVTLLVAAGLVLAQVPAHAEGEDTATATASPKSRPVAAATAPKKAGEAPATKPRISPYAVWRKQREDAERAENPEASGRSHRAARPEGQSQPRRLAQ